MEWLSSGLLACLVQFLAIDIVFIDTHQTAFTIFTALYAKKIFTFADDSIKPVFTDVLTKLISNFTNSK